MYYSQYCDINPNEIENAVMEQEEQDFLSYQDYDSD